MESGLKKILKIAIVSVFTTIIGLLIGFLVIFMIFGSIEKIPTNIYVYIGAFIAVFISYILMGIKSEIAISKEESEVIIERLKKRRFKNFYDGDITVFYKNKIESSIGMEIKVLHNENGTIKLIVPLGYKRSIFISTKKIIITSLILFILSIALIVIANFL